MKIRKLVEQNLNNAICNFSKILIKEILPLLLIFTFSITACKQEVEINSNFAYGISSPFSLFFLKTEPDSVVQINLLDGTFKNLFSVERFDGLKSSKYQVYSKNQNVIVYDIDRTEIGYINLSDLTNKTIDFNLDSTFVYIKSLIIIESKNVLLSFNIYYDSSDKSHSLEIVEIDLKTFEIKSKSKLLDFDSEEGIFTEIDENNNRIFIVPDNSSESLNNLYIYNYTSKQMTEKQLNANFMDVHYYSDKQCLVGSSSTKNGIGLVSYSINKQTTDTIGTYVGISGVFQKMNYFDKKINSYWLGIWANGNSNNFQFVNVGLSNASFSRGKSMRKFISIIK